MKYSIAQFGLPPTGCLVLLIALSATGTAQVIEDTEVPRPDRSQFLPEQRTIIEDAEGFFDRHRNELTPVQLGAAYGRLGMTYQALRIQAAAIAAYRNAVQFAPEEVSWPFYLAVEYEETGDWTSAEAYYLQSIRLLPGYAYFWLRLGEVALEAGHLEQAGDAFIEAATLNPDMAAAIAGLGKVAMRRDEYSLAIEYLTQALGLQPEAKLLHYRIAQAYRHQGNVAKAEEHLGLRGDKDVTASDRLISLMESFSRSSDYYLGEGTRAASQNQYDRAINAFKLAVTINPDNVAAYTQLALSLRMQGHLDQAEDSLATGLEIDPDYTLANMLMGTVIEEQGRQSEAIPYYRHAVATEPADVRARFMLANSQMRAGNFSQAAENYGMIVAVQPENIRATYLQGLALIGAGDCTAALQPLASSTKLAPRLREPALANVRVIATCPAANPEQKAGVLTIALALYRSDPVLDSAATLAMAMAANHRFQEAIDYQAEAIFEAVTSSRNDLQVELKENMQRYEAEQPATRAFAPDNPVFDPGFVTEDTPTPER